MNHLHTQPIPPDPKSSAESTISTKKENQRIQDILMENLYEGMINQPIDTLRLKRVNLWQEIQGHDAEMRYLNDSSKPHSMIGKIGTVMTPDEVNNEILSILDKISKLQASAEVITQILVEKGVQKR